jgi:hypothetical protein
VWWNGFRNSRLCIVAKCRNLLQWSGLTSFGKNGMRTAFFPEQCFTKQCFQDRKRGVNKMMKKLLLFSACVALAAGLLVVTSSEAAAQCGYGGGGYGYGGGHGYGYAAPRTSISVGFGSYHGSSFRGGYGHGGYGHGGIGHSGFGQRGHGNYHPASVYRHGNHHHLQQGHFHSRGWR